MTGSPASQTSVCIGILLKSAEVALLLHPVDQANTLKSPVSENVSPMVPDYLPAENGEFLPSKRKQVSSGINQIRSVTLNHMSDNRSMSVDLSHVPVKDSSLFKSASDTNLQKDISSLPSPLPLPSPSSSFLPCKSVKPILHQRKVGYNQASSENPI